MLALGARVPDPFRDILVTHSAMLFFFAFGYAALAHYSNRRRSPEARNLLADRLFRLPALRRQDAPAPRKAQNL